MSIFKIANSFLDPIMPIIHKLNGKNLSNGQLVDSNSKEFIKTIHPSTCEEYGYIANSNAKDLDLQLKSAKSAQEKWALLSAAERGRLLRLCADLLANHQEELATILTLESGKPIRTESRGEAKFFCEIINFYSGLASELKGETLPLFSNQLSLTIRQPLGVVAAILAWNVPLVLFAYKIAPALIAGNTVIVKPAEEAAFSVTYAGYLINKILPPGVVNILNGSGNKTGNLLINSPDLNKITFTGSVETGKLIYSSAAQNLVPVTLELGGKSPMIVCEDADIEKAVEGAIIGMRFTRQGQSCTAVSRILVHESIYEEFAVRLINAVNNMKMGNPFDEETEIGTVISHKQYKKIKGYQTIVESLTLTRPIYCQNLPINPPFDKGLFVKPLIILDIKNDTKIAQEEIFGPVTCMIKWNNFSEALALANDTKYGLAATIWTNNLNYVNLAVHKLEVGLVQVNQHLPVQPNVSFGGIKLSGLGKEASLEAMLDHFTHKKTILINS